MLTGYDGVAGQADQVHLFQRVQFGGTIVGIEHGWYLRPMGQTATDRFQRHERSGGGGATAASRVLLL